MSCGRYSHAIIVLYPDVWFETTMGGSGFNHIGAQAGTTTTGEPVLIADVDCFRLTVLRLAAAPAATAVLSAIAGKIALEYPRLR